MKSIIITGAGSGLGKELALLFSEKDFHILLAGRAVEKLVSVKHEIESTGGKADILGIDIRNTEDVLSKMKDVSKHYKIVGLVNNAGVGHFGPFAEIDEKQINEMVGTNVLGTIFMTKAIIPVLKQNKEGQIINIISTAGLRGKINEAVYVASKFAIRGFTESLQKEYTGSSIQFTAVYMGGMDTPFWDDSNHIKDKSRLRSAKEIAGIIMNQLDKDTIIIEKENS